MSTSETLHRIHSLRLHRTYADEYEPPSIQRKQELNPGRLGEATLVFEEEQARIETVLDTAAYWGLDVSHLDTGCVIDTEDNEA